MSRRATISWSPWSSLTAARDRAARRQGLLAQADAMRARREGRGKELAAAEIKADEARASAEAAPRGMDHVAR